MSVVQKINQAICFDLNYIYLKENFFKEIASSLLNTFSAHILKKALADDGILCPDKADTYTVKMSYYNIAGGFSRERMLRFSRKKLEKTGEPGFVEICNNRKSNTMKLYTKKVSKVTNQEGELNETRKNLPG